MVNKNHVAARSPAELVKLLEESYLLEDPFGDLARSNDRYNAACEATLLAD